MNKLNHSERGRLGGLVSGAQRMTNLSAEQRSSIASTAAKARWIKEGKWQCPTCGKFFAAGEAHMCNGFEMEDFVKRWVKKSEEKKSESDTPDKNKSGFEDDPDFIHKPCNHPEHAPPMYIFIPTGKRYRHVCPGCGFTVVLRGSNFTC